MLTKTKKRWKSQNESQSIAYPKEGIVNCFKYKLSERAIGFGKTNVTSILGIHSFSGLAEARLERAEE